MTTNYEQFFNSFIETMLWSTSDTTEEGEYLDSLGERYDKEDIEVDTLEKLDNICFKFWNDNKHLILDEDSVDNQASHAGHDFWLTCAGHGAGFWDGDWPKHGDTLTDLCESHELGKLDVYVGDDNLIYI